ncbi:Uncharacterized protein DBV15_00061, partial [Temnothorax longispinosus]
RYVIPDVTLPDSRQLDKVPSPWLSTARCRAVVSAFSPPRNVPTVPFIDRSNHGFMRLSKCCTSQFRLHDGSSTIIMPAMPICSADKKRPP